MYGPVVHINELQKKNVQIGMTILWFPKYKNRSSMLHRDRTSLTLKPLILIILRRTILIIEGVGSGNTPPLTLTFV